MIQAASEHEGPLKCLTKCRVDEMTWRRFNYSWSCNFHGASKSPQHL